MKTITLSDHTADKATAAAARRESDFSDATDTYRKSITARETRLANLRAAIVSAWRERKVATTLSGLGRLVLTYLSSKPQPPVRRSADREEIVWASGNEGEHRVATFFAKRLTDEWVLVSGYRNAKGEIDQVLIGPRGVFAIEIKFINGVVYCDGDRWWRDKHDRYGNLVESNLPIEDKHGRGPSRQLNESADMLQSFLAKRAGLSRVHRTVMLSHETSRLGEMKNITVDSVATVDGLDLARFFERSSTALDAMAIERVVQSIQKDHHFHQKPRAQRTRS